MISILIFFFFSTVYQILLHFFSLQMNVRLSPFPINYSTVLICIKGNIFFSIWKFNSSPDFVKFRFELKKKRFRQDTITLNKSIAHFIYFYSGKIWKKYISKYVNYVDLRQNIHFFPLYIKIRPYYIQKLIFNVYIYFAFFPFLNFEY